MSQLVKTKRQANFKDFKRFGAFKGLVQQKNVVFNAFVCKMGSLWHSWAFKTFKTLKRLKVLKRYSAVCNTATGYFYFVDLFDSYN
jgi:hypothetical protein